MGQALTSLTLGQEKEAEVSLPMGANILRVIGPGVVRTRDIPSLSGVSKEAVVMAINFLEARHMAEPVPGGSVRLTVTGLDALDGFRDRAAQVKDKKLRTVLQAVVSAARGVGRGAVAARRVRGGGQALPGRTQRLLADPTAALPGTRWCYTEAGGPTAPEPSRSEPQPSHSGIALLCRVLEGGCVRVDPARPATPADLAVRAERRIGEIGHAVDAHAGRKSERLPLSLSLFGASPPQAVPSMARLTTTRIRAPTGRG